MASAKLQVEVASLTHQGRVRARNEDTVWSAAAPDAGSGWSAWLILADGAGGHAAGEQASQAAVEAARGALTRGCSGKAAALARHVRAALDDANEAVKQVAERVGSMSGSTLTVLGLHHDQVVLGHIGDSRAYRLRGGQLEQLSVDHTMVAAAVAAGRMTPDEAATSPFRHQLLQGLGMDADLEPQVAVFDVTRGDVLLLACDGLWEVVGDELLGGQMARADAPPAAIAEELVRVANERGGPDNISVAVARCSGPAEAPRTAVGRGLWLVALLLAAGLLAALKLTVGHQPPPAAASSSPTAPIIPAPLAAQDLQLPPLQPPPSAPPHPTESRRPPAHERH